MTDSRRALARLSALQLAVLRVLWRRGDATVPDVQQGLLDTRELAPSTVATILARMRKRGLVARDGGKPYRYRAAVSEREVRRAQADDVAERVFEGDVASLISHLLEAGRVGAGELAEVRRLIDEHERRAGVRRKRS